jgi:protease-4
VDELGGLTAAIAKAKELAEIEADADVRLMTFPKSAGGLPFLSVSSGASAQELKAIGQLAEMINDPEVQALMTELEAARSSRIQARMPTFIEN